MESGNIEVGSHWLNGKHTINIQKSSGGYFNIGVEEHNDGAHSSCYCHTSLSKDQLIKVLNYLLAVATIS